MSEQHTPEPFGYFKPEPFGWTDCAESDDDAIPLYDKVAIKLIEKQRDKLSAEVEELKLIIATDTGTESAVANLQQQVSHLVDMVACEKSNAEYFKRQRDELIENLEHIAKANWREWDEGVRSADAFFDWAKSRARFIVDTIKGAAK